MHFERIFIQKNFQSHPVDNPFLYVNIGIGLFINEGEHMEDAEKAAEQYIKEYIEKNTVYPDHNHIELRTIPEAELPSIQVEKKGIGATLEEQILSSPDLTILKSYSIIARNNPVLHDAYYRREFELHEKLKQIQS